MNESCRIYAWVMLHVWMGHVARMNAWCHIYDPSHHVTHTWLIHMCDMTHSYMWHDSFICATIWYIWRSHHGTHRNASSHIWMRDVICMNASCHTCSRQADRCEYPKSWQAMGMAYEDTWVMSHVWIYISTRTWISHVTHEWVMSHICMSHVACIHKAYTYEWVKSHMWMSHVTHVNESRHTCECVTSHVWMTHRLVELRAPKSCQAAEMAEQVKDAMLQRARVRSSSCSVLQCVAVCCSVLQYKSKTQCCNVRRYAALVAAWCSVMQRDAVVLQCDAVCCSVFQCVAVCCSVLQCVVVCCSVLKCVEVCCSVFQWLQCKSKMQCCNVRRYVALVAVCCSVLQCVAVCCSVLQCVAVCCSTSQRCNAATCACT